MLERTKTNSSPLEIDKAFQYAVTLAWEDLMTPIEPRAIRVEYLWEPGSPLDHLSVWSVRAGGYQDLVCDFRASASLAHPRGACFGNRHSSDKLAAALDFIMKNRGQFTRPADAGRHGLVLIHAPDADDRREATTWMKVARALQGTRDVEQAAAPPDDHRHDEEASSRMDEEGCSSECDGALPDATGYSGCEPCEAPAKTNAADYFELRYAWPE
jgi:hypothetical protein